jgi:hypothetical protein
VFTNTEKIRVRSEKFYGGAGLRRCNRSRGFSANFTRHKNLCDNYVIFQGLICNSFTGGGYCSSNEHGRSRDAGQMKEDDEGIPFHTLLTVGTHRGDRILQRKIMAAVLFRLLFLAAVCCAPGDL